jgi:ABC-type phosphate transport system substrate-binding protein
MYRMPLLAAAVIIAMTAPGAANAQTTIYGGGSTLAPNEYMRTINAVGSTTGFYDTALASGNQGAIGQIGNVLFTADGSSAGRAAFLTQNESIHIAGSAYPAVHFAASDLALTQGQIDCWNSGFASNALASGGCAASGFNVASTFTGGRTRGGPLIELPAFGIPLVIAYSSSSTRPVTLQDMDVCGIFSGKITQWNHTLAGPKSGLSGLSGTINVVVRAEGSHTTLVLTQYLSNVCATGTSGNSAITFAPTNLFSSLFSGGILPSNFNPRSGIAAVADAISSTGNAIGYVTPDYTSIAPNSIPNSTAGSSINAWIPSASSRYLKLKPAQIYNDHEQKAYFPTIGATNLALRSPNIASGDTVPKAPASKTAALNPTNWIPVIGDPLRGYPIVGYTTLEFAQCYSNAAIGTEIKAWITQLYSSANKSNLVNEGFAAVPASIGADILKIYTSNWSGFAMDIDENRVCNGTGASGTYTGL